MAGSHILHFLMTRDIVATRIGPPMLAFYRNLLNLGLLFKKQKELTLSPVFKWLDISELKMPKLIDLCGGTSAFPLV